MAMLGTNEYVSQMNTNLHLIFGCEKFFNDWLDLQEGSRFDPTDERTLFRAIFRVNASSVTPGQTVEILTTDEILDHLKAKGIDWQRAIREQFEKAESDWPAVADLHRTLLDRIRKVWL